MGEKTEMKFIEDELRRQVSFSKRRNGLLKKALEIYINCGVDVAVVAFSPSRRLSYFCSGNTRIEDILERYMQLPEDFWRRYISDPEKVHQIINNLKRDTDEYIRQNGFFEEVHQEIASVEEKIRRVTVELRKYKPVPEEIMSVEEAKACRDFLESTLKNIDERLVELNANKNDAPAQNEDSTNGTSDAKIIVTHEQNQDPAADPAINQNLQRHGTISSTVVDDDHSHDHSSSAQPLEGASSVGNLLTAEPLLSSPPLMMGDLPPTAQPSVLAPNPEQGNNLQIQQQPLQLSNIPSSSFPPVDQCLQFQPPLKAGDREGLLLADCNSHQPSDSNNELLPSIFYNQHAAADPALQGSMGYPIPIQQPPADSYSATSVKPFGRNPTTTSALFSLPLPGTGFPPAVQGGFQALLNQAPDAGTSDKSFNLNEPLPPDVSIYLQNILSNQHTHPVAHQDTGFQPMQTPMTGLFENAQSFTSGHKRKFNETLPVAKYADSILQANYTAPCSSTPPLPKRFSVYGARYQQMGLSPDPHFRFFERSHGNDRENGGCSCQVRAP